MSSKMNVLIAEDSLTFRAILSDILKREGYGIATASDGVEALEKLSSKENAYDLLMLDLQMPNMDGIELLEKLNESKKGDFPPTLILTATTPDSTLLSKLRDLGAKGYIVKSHSPAEIIYRIKNTALGGETRRRDMKELVSISVQYSIGNSFLSVKSFDFNKNGVYIATTNPLPVGNTLDLKFTVPSAKKQIVTRGKVMFSIKYDASQKGSYPPGMGINFMDLKEEDRKTIEEYVEFLRRKKS